MIPSAPTPAPPAAADPSPSPDVTVTAIKQANAFVDWLLGPGVRIALIIVLGVVLLLVVQRLIRAVTEHIADGTSLLQRGVVRPLGGAEVASALRKMTPAASARRTQRARTIGSVLRNTAAIVIGSIVVLLVLDQVGVNIAPFIASAGIVGVAFGFGAQSLVKDFLSGMFMLLEDQYGVGDVVDVGSAQGTVESVGLRVTKVRDSQGTLWYVPNGSMLRVGNKTQGWSNAVVSVQVDYFTDPDEVREALLAAARTVAQDGELGRDLEGEATVSVAEDLTFDAVTFTVTQRTTPARQWAVARALRVAIRRTLEEADIPLAGQREALEEHRARVTGAGTVDTDGAGGAPRDADGGAAR